MNMKTFMIAIVAATVAAAPALACEKPVSVKCKTKAECVELYSSKPVKPLYTKPKPKPVDNYKS
jgi:hypothetical protein